MGSLAVIVFLDFSEVLDMCNTMDWKGKVIVLFASEYLD